MFGFSLFHDDPGTFFGPMRPAASRRHECAALASLAAAFALLRPARRH
jgi:hypothetical protein